MKVLVRLSALFVVMFWGVAYGSLSKNYTFSSSELTLDSIEINGRYYNEISLVNCQNETGYLGKPSLPVKYVQFIIPPNKVVDTIYITSLDSTTILIDAHPMPQQYPVCGPDPLPFVEEGFEYCAYSYPGIPVSINGHGIGAEAHVVCICLYPVQFDPLSKKLKLYTEIGISLHTKDTSMQTSPVYRDSLSKLEKENYWESVVENPEDVHSCLQNTWNLYTLAVEPQEKMAILTVPQFVPAFERLAEWRTQRGCSTGVYTIPSIGSGSNATFLSAEVLRVVREKYSKGCEYILLGGGYSIIPYRTCCFIPYVGTAFTDYYYSDCSADASPDVYKAWDENGNGTYGEPISNGLGIHSLSFTRKNNDYIGYMKVGLPGAISVVLKSTDGGQTWKQEGGFLPFYIHDIYPINSNECVMGTNGNGIYRSTDGGKNWSRVWGTEDKTYVVDIDFVDDDNGWAVGEYINGRELPRKPLLVRTTNGGASWIPVDLGEHNYDDCNLYSVAAVSTTRVWITGISTILRVDIDEQTGAITDIVDEWRSNPPPNTPNIIALNGCAFRDGEHGCVFTVFCNEQSRIYYRDPNAGRWYETSNYPDESPFNFLVNTMAATSSKIYIFGNKGYYSEDDGVTWNIIDYSNWPNVPHCVSLKSNPSYMWVAGGTGAPGVIRVVYTNTPPTGWTAYETPKFTFGDEGVREFKPDIAVGRLPVTTMGEAELLIDKIIRYEKNPPDNYANRGLFMAGAQNPCAESSNYYVFILNAQDVSDKWYGLWSNSNVRYRLFNPLSGPGFQSEELLIRDNALDELEVGYNFVYHVDHSTYHILGTGSQVFGGYVSADDIAALDNGTNWQNQSVIFSQGCETADYRHIEAGGCLSVEFLRNPKAGAAAFIGGVYPTGADEWKLLGSNFTNRLFTESPPSLGDCFDEALPSGSTIAGDFATCSNAHLLGDPSLHMWNGTLTNFADQITWEENGSTITITVRDKDNILVNGATVCLYMKARSGQNGYYNVGVTGPPNYNGKVIFTGVPDGAILVTVTKQNYVPHQEWKIKGNTVTNPIPINGGYSNAMANRRILIDIEGNLHLVYTDYENSHVVAKYGFSHDTGTTWVVRNIDPGTSATHDPVIALRNGLHPYVAYMISTGSNCDRCKLANIEANTSSDVTPDLYGDNRKPAFTTLGGKGYIAVRDGNVLLYREVLLDNIGLGSNKLIVSSKTSSPLPSSYGMADYKVGPAIEVLAYNQEHGEPLRPLIIADAWDGTKSYCYAWFPSVGTHVPLKLWEGYMPTMSVDGRLISIAYKQGYAAKIRQGYYDGATSLQNFDEETPTYSSCHHIQTFSPNAIVWSNFGTGSDIYLSVKQNQSWYSEKFNESDAKTAFLPNADVNLKLNLGACEWTETQDNQYWIHVYANDLEDFPNDNGGNQFPNVSVFSPSAGDRWPIKKARTIAWRHTTTATTATIKLSTNGPDGPWDKTIISNLSLHQGDNFYNWEVGQLESGSIRWETGPFYLSNPNSYVKVICGSPESSENTGISRRFTLERIESFVNVRVPDPNSILSSGPPGDEIATSYEGYQPPGTSKETYWEYVSVAGCGRVDLEISTDSGDVFDSLYYGSAALDSMVYDTLFYETDTTTDTVIRMRYLGLINWAVPNTPCSYNTGCLKLVGLDTLGDTVSCVFGSFTIPIAGCYAQSTEKSQRIMAEGINPGSVGIVYTTKDTDTSASVVRYTETYNGLSLSPPDSVGMGVLPSQSGGQVAWLSPNHDTVYYSYWNAPQQAFSSTHDISGTLGGSGIDFAPVGIVTKGDTVHLALLRRWRYQQGMNWMTKYRLELRTFEKDAPQYFISDTLDFPTQQIYDTSFLEALYLQVDQDMRHLAFAIRDTCAYYTDESGIGVTRVMGRGWFPSIAVYEGNIAYSYLSLDSTRLIRLWRYCDDTTWVDADTLVLTDTVESVTASSGLLYGLQTRDSSKAQVCLFGPVSEAFYPQEDFSGYNLHAQHIQGTAEKWFLGFTQKDNSYLFLSTRAEDIRTLYPALYLKSSVKRSPYTTYRDTCMEIEGILVDLAQDSLVYNFNRLESGTSYSMLLEFLCDADTTNTVAILTNGHLDTLELPSEGGMWYETDMSGVTNLSLKIGRLGTQPITLRRLIVRHSDAMGYLMGAPKGGEPPEIKFCLYQPHPNPFTDAATIKYSLPYATHVSLKVYDVAGRQVAKLVDEEVLPGVHTLRWEGRDNINRRCASGVYFVRLETEKYVASKKMVLVK